MRRMGSELSNFTPSTWPSSTMSTNALYSMFTEEAWRPVLPRTLLA